MIADTVRTGAYARALRGLIGPSSVVLDIGCGTGVFSLLACQYGARRVYAIEPNDAIVIAQAHAQANGYADRIQFIQDLSTKVSLPERVDVLVSDIRGILPFHKSHLPSIVDARKRFLRPGRRQIPLLDKLWAAPVDAPADYARLVLGHHPNAFGLNMEAALRPATNNMYKVRLKAEHLLAGPQCWLTLDYTKVESSNGSSDLDLDSAAERNLPGYRRLVRNAIGRRSLLCERAGQPETVYGQCFFTWPAPVEVAAGDRITVTLKADLLAGDYVWRWESRVNDGEHLNQVKAAFQQSSFFGIPLAPASLRKHSAQFVPTLNENGEIERFIFTLMDGRAFRAGDCPAGLQSLSGTFPAPQEALDRVAKLSSEYSR